MFKLDYLKYKAAFSYMLRELGEIEGKKKACKLFYFLDFDYFELHGVPLTGEVYMKYNMGPFPKYFESMTEEMEREGYITVTHERKLPDHEKDTITYKSKKEMSYNFSSEEVKMLNRVIRIYGGQNGKALQTLSHSEAPWNAVDMYEEIPYELSYYRGTEDLEQ